MDDMCLVYNINLCRICQIPKNLDLIDTSTITDNGETYIDLLKFIFHDIKWVENAFMSLVCQACTKKITNIAEFKAICLESNNRRSILNADLVKFEVEEVEIDDIPELKEVLDDYEDAETEDSQDEENHSVDNSLKPLYKRKRSDTIDNETMVKKVKSEITKSDCSMRLRNRKEVLQYDTDSGNEIERPTSNIGSFECHICHVFFKRLRTLDRHVFKHTGIRTHKCNKCDSNFITFDSLKSHKLNNCIGVTDDKERLEIKKEFLKKGPKNNKRYTCSICNMVFPEEKKLDRHEFGHNGIRKYACEECGVQFIISSDMRFHVRNNCNKIKIANNRGRKPKLSKYACHICQKRFDSKASLERHVYKHNGNRNYGCDGCGMQFITASDLKLHTAKYCNYGNPGKKRGPKSRAPRFVCEFCNKVFDALKPLERHVYRHDGTRNHVCNGCGTRFITGDDLKCHAQSHCNGVKKDKLTITGNHVSRVRKYSCDLCPTDFDRLGNLERHMYQHNGIRMYSCTGCNTKFITQEDLKGHMRRHCMEEKLSCFLCPDKQFTPSTLELHMKMIHMIGMDGKSAEAEGGAAEGKAAAVRKEGEGEKGEKEETVNGEEKQSEGGSKVNGVEKKVKEAKGFKCHYCSMEFSRLKYLDRHIYNHDGTRNYVCNDCGTRSITIDNLRSHMRVVHANKEDFKFLCTECGARFPQSSGLTLHVKRVHANIRDFVCDICNKAFCEKRDLANHMTSHSDVREFKCDLCPAQYKRKDVLLIHKTKRHGIGKYKCQDEKKHECTFCDKKFNVREKLNRHIRSHTGVKPFKCRLCDMKFTCKSYIKGHVMSKHSDLVDEHDFEVNVYCELLEDLVTTTAPLSLTAK